MTEAELTALAAMSNAETVHHQTETLKAISFGGHPIPYGGPYGYDPATTQLWNELQKRGLMP